jgi:fatty acid desaturase
MSGDWVIQEDIKPRKLLSVTELEELNQRSNRKGWTQLALHLLVMGISGVLWITNTDHWAIALPALIVYGFSFAAMFAPMHECVHRTAFASNSINDGVAWFAGLLSFYNGTFYRRYHKWHHRYTQIPGKDPELNDPPTPTHWEIYLWQMSGVPWWIGKIRTHVRIALGQVNNYPFIPESARVEVIRSVQLQLLVYVGAIVLGQSWFLLGWLIPLAVGQPILRFILIAEHTGCTQDDHPLTNTRTTLTLWPLRLLMWNMPFHAMHHLYPSIPFHALPAGHETLAAHFAVIDPGYVSVNRDLVQRFGS